MNSTTIQQKYGNILITQTNELHVMVVDIYKFPVTIVGDANLDIPQNGQRELCSKLKNMKTTSS